MKAHVELYPNIYLHSLSFLLAEKNTEKAEILVNFYDKMIKSLFFLLF